MFLMSVINYSLKCWRPYDDLYSYQFQCYLVCCLGVGSLTITPYSLNVIFKKVIRISVTTMKIQKFRSYVLNPCHTYTLFYMSKLLNLLINLCEKATQLKKLDWESRILWLFELSISNWIHETSACLINELTSLQQFT